jgi:thiamine-monophosphate kinase
VWVSGSIGDAGLGLVQSGESGLSLSVAHTKYLISRYQVPEPRLKLGMAIAGLAHACIDVSDGLIADLGHICAASGVSMRVNASDVPLSTAAEAAVEATKISIESLLTSGDDYELAFTAPKSARTRLEQIAALAKVAITRIGQAGRGKTLSVLDDKGAALHFDRPGFTHF